MMKIFRRLTVNLIVIVLVISGLHCYVNDTKTVLANDEYVVVWEDNFEGNSLNRNYWNVEVNGDGGGNQELQYYRDSTDNIQVSNGTLKIKGLRQSYSGKNYTSGRINTRDKAEFRYGKIEARMKLPSFTGAWPAFWMLGGNHSEIGWPRCGEIDIMEAINTENFTHGALHWYSEGQQGSGGDSDDILPDNFDRTQWHVYALEWNETTMKWSVDGEVFFTDNISDGNMGEFRKEQFIILNLAIGGQWPGWTIDNSKFPVTMEVDYVRVSQRASDANIIKGSGVKNVSPIIIPTETETRNVIEYKGSWNVFYNTAVVSGSGSSANSKGYIANIDYLGSKGRLIKASITNVEYIPGNTYKYSLTIESDIDKYVCIKAVGEDHEEDIFANYTIFLQGGVPYKFTEDVKIDREYDGRLDLIIEMGGRIGGEYLPTNTSLTIKMTDASFVGEASVLKEIPTQRPTTELSTTKPPVIDNESNNNTETTINGGSVSADITETTSDDIENVTKPDKVKIKKVKNLKTKKVKVTWKKVVGATKYQVRIVCGKMKIVKTTTELKYTFKKLKKNKKYKVYVRAYNQAGYGKWSTVKKIRITK